MPKRTQGLREMTGLLSLILIVCMSARAQRDPHVAI